jgi:hypothetical protein
VFEGLRVSCFIIYFIGVFFVAMTLTNHDTYFSFGCKANHKEVEKLTIINIVNELVQQSIDTMDETFITKPMIEGVEVDGT